jgi:uncharacterized protein (DUF2164 family)
VAIKLEKETRRQAADSIQRYFDLNMEESIGNLQATALLDFLIEEIGPSIYNKAVRDVQEQMQLRVQELDIEVHEDEFNYWQNQKKKR